MSIEERSIVIISKIVSIRLANSFDYGANCSVEILVDNGSWLRYDFYSEDDASDFFDIISKAIMNGKKMITYEQDLPKQEENK